MIIGQLLMIAGVMFAELILVNYTFIQDNLAKRWLERTSVDAENCEGYAL